MNSRDHDVPLLHGTISIRNPRRVALLHPFQLCLSVCLLGVAVVFTILPEALDHAPIAFDARGFVHHVWHYALLAGSVASLVGMLVETRRRLKIELAGVLMLSVALAWNTVASVTAAIVDTDVVGGLGLALRLACIGGLLLRVFTIATEPTVQVPVQRQ